ncbi:XRE family transcriptional regulator [Streptomyces klenkii]|uniref:XRE family transcriptional regulator n=1 Tax=Streptomyces klenkii TaxID=1420899 RepID=A0A3B0AM32_9ACTN|nr:helix-turn-helix transcriptional regulator [Streptomyces klenkii]RKN61344.1 XRE family transcriptional regulator [Streptomyces klenkii]
MNPVCEHCGSPLPSTGEPKVGRPQKYCSTACRQAAHRQRRNTTPPAPADLQAADTHCRPTDTPQEPAAPPALRPPPPARRPQATGEADEALAEITRDIQEELRALQRSLPTADPTDLLRLATRIRTQLDGLTAALVGRARHRRTTWNRIGHILGISEDTARHRYTDHYILRRLSELTRMSSPPATLKDLYTAPAPRHQPSPVPVPPLGSIHARPRPAFNRLAPVLSMLARTSQKPMKELSERTRCSASYLSRILNGERIPTWELTERFARACGADPAVLRSVWETERLRSNSPLLETEDDDEGDDEDPHRAGARLLRALRTLHVRAGQPTAYDIATAGKHQLTVTLITAVLEGIRFPGWRDLVSLLNVLGGDISYFQPLWEAAVRPATPPTETTPAAPSPHPEPSSPPQDPSCGHPIVSPDASGSSSTRGQQAPPAFNSAGLCEVISSYREALADQAALLESQRERLFHRIAQRRISGNRIPRGLGVFANP